MMTMNNPVVVDRMLNPRGEEIILTQWGDDDYDAYWTNRNYSVRGTLEQIMEEIKED